MPRLPDPDVDDRIRRAATALLMNRGLDFTMDEVALAAGVGRASVFRRYATKRDLLLETVTRLMDASVTAPDTGSLRGDLTAIVNETVAGWQTMEPLSRQMFGATAGDPGMAELFRTMMRDRVRREQAVFERARQRGELREDLDLWLLSDLIVAVVAYRGMLGLACPSAEVLVEALLHGFSQ